MVEDMFGLRSSSTDPDACMAFEEAVHGLAAHRPSTGAALGRALLADPDHVAANALKGFANLILAREELVPQASAALTAAKAALARRGGGTADERILVAALGDAVDGSFTRAADRLDSGFADRPAAFLPFKLSHALRFMLGDAAGMLAQSDRMIRCWTPDLAAAGYLLGCHAFGLEEHGHYAAAERFGRRAVAIAPDDAWGLHAVSHVHEMRGETAAGIEWLEEGRPNWSRCNNFSFHMAWHLGLLHLERGDGDRVLDLYDREVRPEPTDDVRDVANAVSLLWRLDRAGIDVGQRWEDLAAIVRRRRTDTTLVFASLHTLVALVAIGDRTAVGDAVAALRALAEGEGDQARVAREVGLPMARLIAGRSEPRGLAAILSDLPRLGGSNAQRDLFVLHLAEQAGRAGEFGALARIRSLRHRLKAEDRLIDAIGAPDRLARIA